MPACNEQVRVHDHIDLNDEHLVQEDDGEGEDKSANAEQRREK